MTYIFDNNISPRYAKMLAALDVNVKALREVIPANTSDVEFLDAFRELDIVFISADSSITTRPGELVSLRQFGKTALFLGPFWSKMEFWKGAEWMVRRWPLIHGFAVGAGKGKCAVVKQNGRSQIFTP